MAKIRIPGLIAKRNKTGVTSWYWQPSDTLRKGGWTPLTLGKAAGNDPPDAVVAAARQRNVEVEQWKHGGLTRAELKKRHQAGTLGAWIARYRRDVIEGKKPDGSPKIAHNTAKTYGTGLKRLEAWAGKHPLPYITRARVKVLRDKLLETAGHHAAHSTLKHGRQLFAYIRDQDETAAPTNPFESFGLAAPDPRDVIWSPPARELMIATASAKGFPSIALAIMLGFGIGQREQDILALTLPKYVAIPEHKMQPEDYVTLAALAPDGVPRGIRVRQQKTGAWVEVPVVGETRRLLESNIAQARAKGSLAIILDDTRDAVYQGKSGQTRFQRDFAQIRDAAVAAAREADPELAAELETLHFSDLRRTCVVYLGELGMDAHLIAGVTGHDIDETQRILRVYMPRTTGRAARAIALASVREAKDAERDREQST
jgi:hypothetical protein